jgi:dihydroorotase
MKRSLIQGGLVFSEKGRIEADILIEGERISKILPRPYPEDSLPKDCERMNATGKWVFPGVIDDQVHFREPGLTHKGNLLSESRAAVAGGITSFMEMPNTKPPAITQELLAQKYAKAAEGLPANYSFFMGTSNDNLDEILKTNLDEVCGLKIFMGASTGNMLVDNKETLEAVFKEFPGIIALHCEDEQRIRTRTADFKEKFGESAPMSIHPEIRDAEACYRSSSLAVDMATKFGTRIHILHISTAKETELFDQGPLEKKRITSEACLHHLWFTDADYHSRGAFIKWNPAVKSFEDRAAIREALIHDRIDVVATDHAPHTLQEKKQGYFECPSGGPLVQHNLVAMLEMSLDGWISPEKIVQKMCHNPARLFGVVDRGFLEPGYFADLVLIEPDSTWQVTRRNLLYHCGWSPLEGQWFRHRIAGTWVNGTMVYDGEQLTEALPGSRLRFSGNRR